MRWAPVPEERVEAGLVERARDGDADAFEALVGRRIEPMVRTATAILSDPDEAREARQEGLVAIWTNLPTLREPDRFDAWVGRILVNRCRLRLRRRGRRAGREVGLEAIADAVSDPGAGPDTHLDRRERPERAFERLEPGERVLLVLPPFDDPPPAEIADRLAIPVGTAKSRLFAARRALEAALEAEP